MGVVHMETTSVSAEPNENQENEKTIFECLHCGNKDLTNQDYVEQKCSGCNTRLGPGESDREAPFIAIRSSFKPIPYNFGLLEFEKDGISFSQLEQLGPDEKSQGGIWRVAYKADKTGKHTANRLKVAIPAYLKFESAVFEDDGTPFNDEKRPVFKVGIYRTNGVLAREDRFEFSELIDALKREAGSSGDEQVQKTLKHFTDKLTTEAKSESISRGAGVAADANGNLFFADNVHHAVRPAFEENRESEKATLRNLLKVAGRNGKDAKKGLENLGELVDLYEYEFIPRMVLGWLAQAPLAPVTRRSDCLNLAPFLWFYGASGLGKTTLTRAALSVFGRDQQRASGESATSGRRFSNALASGLPILFDEIHEDEFSKVLSLAKKSATSTTTTSRAGGGADYSVEKEYPSLAGAAFTSNHALPVAEGLQGRFVRLGYKPYNLNWNSEKRVRFALLCNDLTNNFALGRAYLDFIVERFKTTEQIRNRAQEINKELVDKLGTSLTNESLGYALVYLGLETLVAFFEKHGHAAPRNFQFLKEKNALELFAESVRKAQGEEFKNDGEKALAAFMDQAAYFESEIKRLANGPILDGWEGERQISKQAREGGDVSKYESFALGFKIFRAQDLNEKSKIKPDTLVVSKKGLDVLREKKQIQSELGAAEFTRYVQDFFARMGIGRDKVVNEKVSISGYDQRVVLLDLVDVAKALSPPAQTTLEPEKTN